MILDARREPAFKLHAGSVYRTRAEASGIATPSRLTAHFRQEVSAVWTFLQQARMQPIGLEMLPATDTSATPLAGLASAPPSGEQCTASFVALFTSGTTGAPKPFRHDVASVLERKRPGESNARWLLTYAPFRWAGLSVLLHVLRSDATLVVPVALDPEALIAAAGSCRATHVGLTPSYFRRLQLAVGDAALSALGFEQITFGGELATQPVLDVARRLWPSARVSHVYATTELGDICSVSDGLAGIPQTKLQGPRFGFDSNSQLIADGRPTGDLWALRSGRYHFQGRTQELINVGGAKVSPIEVEAAATALDGVVEARAYAIPSALLGQVVALDYRGEADEKLLRRLLRGSLPKVAWPAVVRRVDRIELTDAAKTRRIEVQVSDAG
jgi:acyl-coenzyme A synthetase/AMP-(fatty) acid ligase